MSALKKILVVFSLLLFTFGLISCVSGGNQVTDKCFDNDKNHRCDACQAVMSECYDLDGDHRCDLCKKETSTCPADKNQDHLCDVCYDYTCVNCCVQPQIIVFSLGEDCYVNGDKYAKIYNDDYSGHARAGHSSLQPPHHKVPRRPSRERRAEAVG